MPSTPLHAPSLTPTSLPSPLPPLPQSCSPAKVTALVLHALASPYPYTRYLAGTYNKRPIAVIRALAYLPDRIQVRTHPALAQYSQNARRNTQNPRPFLSPPLSISPPPSRHRQLTCPASSLCPQDLLKLAPEVRRRLSVPTSLQMARSEAPTKPGPTSNVPDAAAPGDLDALTDRSKLIGTRTAR